MLDNRERRTPFRERRTPFEEDTTLSPKIDWSIFNRGIVRTFHKVSAKELPLYVAEFEFRYSSRKNGDIFGAAVRAC
jgi:hypothetical protein